MEDELLELEDELEDQEQEQESTELTEFDLCIKEYLDGLANKEGFFKNFYDPSKIKKCCDYIINEVKKTKRSAFTDDEIFKMARDFYTDHKDAPKKREKATIVTPTKKEQNKEVQLSLFDL